MMGRGSFVHLVRLIDDLLDVSRISRGRLSLTSRVIQAVDVLRCGNGIRPTADRFRAGHSLTVEVPAEPVWLDAGSDARRSGRRQSSEQCGKIYARRRPYRICPCKADGDDTVIAVSDNGLGIPADMQSKVTAAFYARSDHTDRAQGGLGIGLALASRIVVKCMTARSARKVQGRGTGECFHRQVSACCRPCRKCSQEIGRDQRLNRRST